MSRALPQAARRPLDAYHTPPGLAEALVGLLPVRGLVLEPHAGGGAFVRALQDRGCQVIANDVNPEAPGLRLATEAHVGDFLQTSLRAEWVVGNPPYGGFEAHVDHALGSARHVAFLLRLGVMESASRVRCWQRWPLRRVWVLAERPSFTGGGTDSAAYGFFWFDSEHDGPALIEPGWSWK